MPSGLTAVSFVAIIGLLSGTNGFGVGGGGTAWSYELTAPGKGFELSFSYGSGLNPLES